MRRCPVVVLLLLLAVAPAAAQQRPSFVLAADAGPAFPLGDFADAGAEVGWGLNVSAAVRLTRVLGLYASFERNAFQLEDRTVARDDGTWTDYGFGAGVRAWFPPFAGNRLRPWAQLGLGWHQVDPPIGDIVFEQLDSDGLLAVEGGGGIDVALLGEQLFLRPGVRFRRYAFNAESPAGTTEATVSFLTVALGLAWVPGAR